MNQNSYNELLEKSTNQLDENLLDDYGQFLKKVEELGRNKKNTRFSD